MDIRIGQTGSQSLYTTQPASPRSGSTADDQTANPLQKTQNRDTLKVGFGNDTVSVPGATVRTVGRNLGAGREIIRSTVEAQQTQRTPARKIETTTPREQRALAAEANAKKPSVAIPNASAAAASQARNLVNAVNKAAGEAQARVQGETPQTTQTGSGINFRVGDQTVAVKRTEVPQFDIRA